MTGIILCPRAKGSLETIAQSGLTALIDLCGKTVLERTLDNLIAAGVEKVYIVCEKRDKTLEKTIKRYSSNDKIRVVFVNSDIASEENVLICDVLSCSDKTVIEHIKNIPVNTCLTDKNGEFILVKIEDFDVKHKGLIKECADISQYVKLCGEFEKKSVKFDSIDNVKTFLDYQAKLLDSEKGDVISLTQSNFNGATIIPPVFIGKNVSINSGAVIGKGSVISDNARIGKGARVLGAYVGKCAVIGKNCSVENAYVGSDTRLMNRVWLAAGAAVCAGTCVKSNSYITENNVASPFAEEYADVYFPKGSKQLEFDDDGICSLFDGTVDVSSFVRLGKAIGTALSVNDKVVCGYSAVDNSTMLADALCCGVRSAGVDVLDMSECTVSQLGFVVNRTGASLGAYVGVDANGDIRLVDKCGLPLMLKLEEDICDCYDSQVFRSAGINDFGNIISAESEKAAYHAFLSKIMPKRMKGVNASVRTNDLSAAKICDSIITPANDLNGERVIFQLSNDLTAVNAYCESTGNIRWEQLCLLGCAIMFGENKAVSLPYSVPAAAERLAEHMQGSVCRYCTVSACEKDVKAREIACQPQASFVRDALLLTVMICRYLNNKQISLKEAIADIEQVCCVQRFINISSNGAMTLENAQAVGDEGVILSDMNTSAFVRPSKNRKSLMIFAESTSTEFAGVFCDSIIAKLRKLSDSDNNSDNHMP